MVPLIPLAEFHPHKYQLFPRLAEHVAEEQPQVGEFLPVVTGHVADQGAFAMHYFIVGQGQDEVFVEGVEHAKGDGVVVVAPVDGVMGHIFQGVVHPAHVPFEAEAQAAQVIGPGDHGPSRWILRQWSERQGSFYKSLR